MKQIFIYPISLLVFIMLINAVGIVFRIYFSLEINSDINLIGYIVFNIIYFSYRLFHYYVKYLKKN